MQLVCLGQPLLLNCEHKVLLDDLAAYLFRYMYRTGTALALVHTTDVSDVRWYSVHESV